MTAQDTVYDRRHKEYRLTDTVHTGLTNGEILAVCKMLLESRSMVNEEIYLILDKLVDSCVPGGNRRLVQELLFNEKFHYTEPPRFMGTGRSCAKIQGFGE